MFMHYICAQLFEGKTSKDRLRDLVDLVNRVVDDLK